MVVDESGFIVVVVAGGFIEGRSVVDECLGLLVVVVVVVASSS